MGRSHSQNDLVKTDYREIYEFIAEDDPLSAGRVLDVILRTIEQIHDRPSAFPRYVSSGVASSDLRRAVCLP